MVITPRNNVASQPLQLLLLLKRMYVRTLTDDNIA